jgi:hypothetical protein
VSAMGEGPFADVERVSRPAARAEDLLVEQVNDETVVYDRRTNDAHCLTPLAAAVFAHCDGETPTDRIATLASERLGEPVDETGVANALAQLGERDLLVVSASGNGLSRRQMIGKSAVAAGTLAGASLITSIAAPTALAADSKIPPGCTGCGKNSDCASNHCCQSNAGKTCSQTCCVGNNNSCHVCTVSGTTTCTVTPADIGTGCPTSCPGGAAICCTNTAPC